MFNPDLYIGAFWLSTHFEDVDPWEPNEFTYPDALTNGTKGCPFPSALVHTTAGFFGGSAGGTGGTSAINRIITLRLASPPKPVSPGNTILESDGINGEPLYLTRRGNIRSLTLEICLPDLTPSDGAAYNDTWGNLQLLAHSHPRIWVLHERFAFSGFIEACDDLWLGQKTAATELMSFKVKRMYRVTEAAGNRLYSLLSYT